MPSGSCTCGAVQMSFEGDPIAKGLCHCTSCRKLSGTTYTTSCIVSADKLKVTGKLKSYSRTADNGNTITNYFCDTCCSPLYGEGGFGDSKVVRMGIMDGDGLANAKPDMEVFSERRIAWVTPVEGALSVKGMGGSQELVADNSS